jgi:hypothetical protein
MEAPFPYRVDREFSDNVDPVGGGVATLERATKYSA